jgi:diguanylate cyclase (GGDEF)-like protein
MGGKARIDALDNGARPLTGLASRTLLLERLQESLDRTRSVAVGSVAVLVADIDQFKLVNDSFGHAAGDDLLVEVSRRWEQALRSEDLVARLGGDEFVVLCNDADEAEARLIADRMLQTLHAPINLQGRVVGVSASIGIAVTTACDGEQPDAAEILRYADAAMDEAKAQARGRTAVFNHGLIDRTQSHLRMYNELKEAVERNQLTLHYQPVVELTTGRMVGVEALCRWTHPERGVVPPDEFIPLAEQTGLIDQLDDWVLARACAEGVLMRAERSYRERLYRRQRFGWALVDARLRGFGQGDPARLGTPGVGACPGGHRKRRDAGSGRRAGRARTAACAGRRRGHR